MLLRAVPLSRIQLARYLRRTMSGIEWNLWSCLRGRQLDGFKFRRKAVIGPHMVDFACLSARLVIEIDAGMLGGRGVADDGRAAWLASRDFRIVRFTDEDVAERIEQVLDTIRAELAGRPRYLSVAAYARTAGEKSRLAAETTGAGTGRESFHGRRFRPHHRGARAP